MKCERFTERVENGGIRYLDRNDYYHTFYDNGASDPVHVLATKLCEFEDKIERGMLKELPGKIGDDVYVILETKDRYALVKDKCDGFLINDEGIYVCCKGLGSAYIKYYFTREEAKKSLKELQNG